MINTGYDIPEIVLRHRANGYMICNNNIVNSDFIDMGLPFAAGALYSTVEDLYLWNQSLCSHTILPKEDLEEMFTQIHYWPTMGTDLKLIKIYLIKLSGIQEEFMDS